MKDIEALQRRIGTDLDYRQFDINALAPVRAPPPPAAPPPPQPPQVAATPVAAASGFQRYGDKPAGAEPPRAGTPLIDLFRKLERHAR